MSFNSKSLTCLLITIFLILALQVNTTMASQLTVSQDGSANFTSIQEAVDNASNGDTIVVYPGTYAEKIQLSLERMGGKTALYDLTFEGISSPTITGLFRIEGPVSPYVHPKINIRGFDFSGAHVGIYGLRVPNYEGQVTIDNNKFTNSRIGIGSG